MAPVAPICLGLPKQSFATKCFATQQNDARFGHPHSADLNSLVSTASLDLTSLDPYGDQNGQNLRTCEDVLLRRKEQVRAVSGEAQPRRTWSWMGGRENDGVTGQTVFGDRVNGE